MTMGCEQMLGRELWSCFADPTTQELYRQLVRRARAGREVKVPYRCDTAVGRRWFELRIAALPGGEVEFESTLVREEVRPTIGLLEENRSRDARFVRMCSWCQRVASTDGSWRPVEEAVAAMGLLQTETVPRITHSICEPCAAHMRRMMEDAGAPGAGESPPG